MNSNIMESWTLTYSDEYDELVGNILKVTPDFVQILQQNESIIIEGNEDDDFLFSVENKTYKLRDIFLPSTMILTPALATLDQQAISKKKVAYVSLETAHYFKLEPHNIEYHLIYSELMHEAVNKELFQEAIKMWNLVISSGLTVESVCSRFRVTPSQLQQLVKHTPIIVLHHADQPQLEEPTLIVFGLDSLLSAMRQLLPYLMEQDIIGEWFDYSQLIPLGVLKHEKVLMLLAKIFAFDVQGNCESLYSLTEPMEVEKPELAKFKCKLETIIRFVLLEHALAKHEYTTSEMDETLWKLVLTYLPIGLAEYEQPKAKKLTQQLMGLYFLTIPRHPIVVRIYYDPLYIGSSVKERLQFLRIYKKKFTLKQLQGIFSHMIGNQIELGDIVMKNFRKCGQEYEMKLVIPK